MCVCVQGLSVCGSFYQAGAVHRWENVTNYYPTYISHSRSLLRISACAVTHIHTHTRSCLEVIQMFRYSLRFVYTSRNHLHHVKPALLRKTNTDKMQTANYREEILLLITNIHVWKRLKGQIWPNTNESIKKVCLVCVNIPGFFEFL